MQLIGAQLMQVPEPLGTVRGDVPPALATLVAWCLAKEPAARPANAGELLAALDTVSVTPAEPTRAGVAPAPPVKSGETRKIAERSLVVLPFANLSADPDNEYFSDGLTDELIADLSRVKALKVISRTSAMRFKGSDRSARADRRGAWGAVRARGQCAEVGDSAPHHVAPGRCRERHAELGREVFWNVGRCVRFAGACVARDRSRAGPDAERRRGSPARAAPHCGRCRVRLLSPRTARAGQRQWFEHSAGASGARAWARDRR